MSKEWTHYKATCLACGNEGGLAMWMDDWNRWDAGWAGFKGLVRITGPAMETVRCGECDSGNVIVDQISN